MDKISRETLINELDSLSGSKLATIEKNVNERWNDLLSKYPGVNINEFPGVEKAGEIVFKNTENDNKNTLFPQLKANWFERHSMSPSSYIITVDGMIVKIGALKSGVRSNSFGQYFVGVTGSPSRRSCGVYTFLSAMLKSNKKVDVYHVKMDEKAVVNVPTINGIITKELNYSSQDIEKVNVDVYKEKANGIAPLLNFKERNATFPREFDDLYNLINDRVSLTKNYRE